MFYTRINLVFTSIMNKFGINSNRWEYKLDKATCQSGQKDCFGDTCRRHFKKSSGTKEKSKGERR